MPIAHSHLSSMSTDEGRMTSPGGSQCGNLVGLEGWCRVIFTADALTVQIILFKLKNKLDFVSLTYCQAQSLF